jgi:uncharacterized protein (TIGR03067 family)
MNRTHSQTRLSTFTLLGAACLAVLASGLRADKSSEDQKKLQGTWQVTTLQRDGEDVDKTQVNIEFLFKGDQVTIKRQNQEDIQATFKLTPAAKPKLIDLKLTAGPDKDKDVEGIYQFQGDELRLCVAKPDNKNRPTEFATKAGSETILLVLKRQKP